MNSQVQQHDAVVTASCCSRLYLVSVHAFSCCNNGMESEIEGDPRDASVLKQQNKHVANNEFSSRLLRY